MVSTTKAIYNALLANTDLMNLLAANAPFYDVNGAKTQANSIIVAGQATSSTLRPFLTVQEGVTNKMGKKLTTETFYIRVYNDRVKSFVQIDNIGEKIVETLDEMIFSLDKGVMVKAKYDSMLSSATDESLDLNFRELHFTIYLL